MKKPLLIAICLSAAAMALSAQKSHAQLTPEPPKNITWPLFEGATDSTFLKWVEDRLAAMKSSEGESAAAPDNPNDEGRTDNLDDQNNLDNPGSPENLDTPGNDVGGANPGEILMVHFDVDKHGHVANVHVMSGGHAACDIKAIIESSPDWTPGRKKRRPVEILYHIIRKTPDGPLEFKRQHELESEMPTFQGGGLDVFRNWVMQQLVYPPAAQGLDIEGRVTMKFVVNRRGEVENLEEVSSPSTILTTEAARVIFISPRWEPGTIEGVPVRVAYLLPIDFKLERETKVVYRIGTNRRLPSRW
ncbi:MAG: energy transducer TonB [Alistipes sp.]|jgi:hypothetical protein|nr:energy transducer TonB [Alistipes sp.]